MGRGVRYDPSQLKEIAMYYVMNDDNVSSWSDEVLDKAEMFEREEAAVARAKALSKDCPGKEFFVAKRIARIFTPIGDTMVGVV